MKNLLEEKTHLILQDPNGTFWLLGKKIAEEVIKGVNGYTGSGYHGRSFSGSIRLPGDEDYPEGKIFLFSGFPHPADKLLEDEPTHIPRPNIWDTKPEYFLVIGTPDFTLDEPIKVPT